MNWFRENKFLGSFLSVLLIGVGVLGYFLYSAWSNASEVSENYSKKVTELKRLQSLNPFPDEENLKKVKAQNASYVAAATEMERSLAANEIALEPMTPELFQDRLRSAVLQVLQKAKVNGVQIGRAPAEGGSATDKFYLGFDTYQATLPKPEAAPLLGRQLRAIEFAVTRLIDAKVTSINSLTRSLLPGEGNVSASGAPVAPASRAKKLVDASHFEIAFTAEQGRLRRWLNDVSTAKEQFFIVRVLNVKNQVPKGPPRIDPAAAAATATAGSAAAAPATGDGPFSAAGVTGAAAAASPSPTSLKFVVGNEKVEVVARVDIVDFSPPGEAAAAK